MVNVYGRTPEEIEASSPYNQYIPPGHAEGASPSPWEQQNQMVSPASGNDQVSQQLAAGQWAQTEAQRQQYQRVQEWKQQQELLRQQQQEQFQRQQAARLSYAEQARLDAARRAGYASDLGDRETQRRIAAGENAGEVLESQRQAAYNTPTLVDDRFFENELGKYVHNPVEVSSAYHALGMKECAPIPANPYENQGDVALAFEKAGSNPKDFGNGNYDFNPNVKTMINILPGGVGLQQNAWEAARTGIRQRTDYKPAIVFLNAQQGRQGVYGNLAGGIPDKAHAGAGAPSKSDVGAGGYIIAGNRTGRVVPVAKSNIGVTYSDTEDAKGEIPFFGAVPFLSPFLAKNFGTPTRTETTIGKPESTRLFSQYKLATSISGLDAAPWVSSVVVDKSKPIGEKRAVGSPKYTTKFNPETGMMETTAEQAYEQEYAARDIGLYTSTPIAISTSAGKSKFDIWQGDLSNRAYSGVGSMLGQSGEQLRKNVNLFGEIQAAQINASPTPDRMAQGLAFGMVKETMDKPVEGAVWAGIAAATYGIGGGLEYAGARIAPRLAGHPTVVKAASTIWKGIPYALGGIYAVDSSSRITKGYTDFRPGQVSQRTGGVLATEVIPMYVGWKVAANAPAAAGFAYRSAAKVPGKMSDAAWSMQQRMGGITRMEPGARPYAFSVTGKPIYEVPRTPSFYNDEGMASWGGVNRRTPQKMAPEIETIDLRQEINFAKMGRPDNVATPAEQAMVMAQYKLTPQEIRLAKMQGLSLNDILQMRELAPVTLAAPIESEMGMQSTQMMQMQRPATFTINRAWQGTQQVAETTPMFGTRTIVGSNVISKLFPRVDTFSTSMTDEISRNMQRQKQKGLMISLSSIGFGSLAKTITGTVPDTRQRRETILTPLSGTRTIPWSETKVTPWSEPKTFPWTEPTTTTSVPPIIPLPFWMGGGSSGTFGGVRGKKPWRELIPLRNVLMTKGKSPFKMPAMSPLPAPKRVFYRAVGRGAVVSVESAAAPRRVATKRKAAPRRRSMWW